MIYKFVKIQLKNFIKNKINKNLTLNFNFKFNKKNKKYLITDLLTQFDITNKLL